jgi:hypothetical protein
MKTPHYAMLGEFMQKGGVLEKDMQLPESLNVEEMMGRTVGGAKDYTLTYFGFHGRGSAMCFMMSRANANWEKKALTFPEWGALKAKQGGGLPVINYGGKLY